MIDTRTPGVRNFLDASTAHVSKTDNAMLTYWATLEPEHSEGSAPFRTIAHAYGYFVNVQTGDTAEAADQDAREQGMGEGFFALVAYARANGCWWINLDRDADHIDELPTFEW